MDKITTEKLSIDKFDNYFFEAVLSEQKMKQFSNT